ncbi:MAG: SMC-Scp complex subunit ScpB [Acidobacteria bacterium]|nr:SMC-Scp complex subunit ScpB [Acidobacteriota bacterium]
MSTGETHDAARVIEGVLMVAIEPVPVELLAQLLETPVAGVEAIIAELKASYEEQGRGFELVKVAGGYRFQSHPDVSPYVERFVLDGQRARLSAAALETLAIIAYKQPISRLQIASIRGVDPDAVLRTLQGRGYIEQRGRDDGPGQAVLWGTTPLFLEKLGINSVDELPPLAEFVPDAEIVEALEATLRITPIEAESGGAGGDAPTSDD